ncbi:MAG: response regulator [Erythrobacter sp.]|nr:response regulator [Erythrobacter sp.]
MSASTILVVDDDTALRQLIVQFLASHDFAVVEAEGVAAMRQQLAARAVDLIVLDQMMPGEDGLSALRSLPPGNRPPVIMLSAMSGEVDRIVGLELGADDYLAKPCNPRELLARIRAVLRRGDPVASDSVLEFGGWRMDRLAHELFAPDGGKVALTTREWRLLLALVEGQRRVLTRDDLMSRMEGEDFDSFDRAIDIAISRLRRKLAEHDPREVVRTVRGEGYALALPVAGR